MDVVRGGELSLEDKRALLARLLHERMAAETIRIPLSEGQKALWFVCQDPDAAPAYNTSFAAEVRSAVDLKALERAVQALITRHPALRTVFAVEPSGPMQVVRASAPADVQAIDARGWAVEAMRDAASEAARQPFDLETGPLVRVRLFTRSADDHVLLIVLHHLIQDGWSLWLLLDELAIAYRAETAREALEFSEITASYRDFVSWQTGRLAGAEGEADWGFWRDRLTGELPQLDVSRDTTVEPPPPYSGAAHRFSIAPDLREGLEALSRDHGVTLNATLLSAFSVLLGRQTGQDEVLVGALSGGSLRAEARFAEVVGYFVNPVLERTELDPATPFAQHLQATHDRLLDAVEHQDFPFSRIVERLQPDRQGGRAPLAQAMFALQRPQRARDLAGFMAPCGPPVEVDFGGLRLAPFDLPVRDTPFELLLDVFVTRDRLACSLRYATRLFADATIRGLAAQFRRLLAAVVENPRQAIGQLPVVDADERRRLLAIGQGQRLAITPNATVQGWLEAAAAAHADAPAIVFQGQSVAYGDLNRRANRLAHHLRGLGVGPGAIVAISLPRSIEMIVAVLAIFKSGGAYLPLDPEGPDDRVNLMLSDSAAAVVLTDAAQAGRFTAAIPVVVVDTEMAAAGQDDNPLERGEDTTLAYVIYTSGSTGRPKGVRVIRRTLVNLVEAMRDLLRLGPQDSFLAVTSLAFDVSVVEIFAGLCVGARLILADRHEVKDGAALRRLIETHDPTFMQATPASWQLLLASGWRGSRRMAALSAGEALSTWLGGRLLDTCGAVWNLYGPTEATVYATGHRLSPDDIVPGGAAGVTIGRPLANMQAYILDARLELVPVGAPGELFVGGAGVAEGYLGRPELTAEKFICDPFSADPTARLYRTGDLACWRADGSIEFRGRLDDQLKIRGHRIEPGEIEAALNEHPEVSEAVVVAREDVPGDTRLVGYVALADPVLDEAARDWVHLDLRDRLARRFPEYMRPSALVFLEALPRTTSGKIARRALPAPAAERPPLASAYVTPRSEIEARIAAVWMEVLNTEHVGVHDNFFDLGGHSLLAVTAQTRLSALVGRPLAPTLLLEHSTIHALAAHLAGLGVAMAPQDRSQVTQPAPEDKAARPDRIAIVGIACRVPGADSPEAFWRNLEAGVESISRPSAADLATAGVDPSLVSDPRFVPASGLIDGIDRFDARLFGYSGRDAALMDPQQRVFLECAWEALEHAGYNGERRPGVVGVFAGSGVNAYAAAHAPAADPGQPAAAYQQMLGNEKDYLATRIAYKLNLSGPCLTVQTACSTGLAAVHLACESLLSGACDLALGGGVSLRLPSQTGYLFQDGMILSPDGRCRAFDADAQGTVPGSGAGVVVLKRLSDAQRDGDTIHGLICGSALNNDGARKAGFTAPSLEGQAAAVAAAIARSGVTARAIGYVEAHGTGTRLGDPIEVAALTRAFRASTPDRGYCAIGSVKTNLGHLDAAAGVVGLIKAVLSVGHGKIPASLNFREPNPAIDFAASPFFVNAVLRDWDTPVENRYAGVSAFGIGGANVHMVVSGAPPVAVEAVEAPDRPLHVLTLTAMDDARFAELAGRYARALAAAPESRLADICHTANVGRRGLARRLAVVGGSVAELASNLASLSASAPPQRVGLQGATPKIAFLVATGPTGSGALGRELYLAEPAFRSAVDRCDMALSAMGRPGLASRVAASGAEADAEARFAVAYGLADLLRTWGLQPDAVAGADIGTVVAGVVAGAVGLEDGLRLAAAWSDPRRYADLVRVTPISAPRMNLLTYDDGFAEALATAPSARADLGPALEAFAGQDEALVLGIGATARLSSGPPVVPCEDAARGVWRPLLEALAHGYGLGVPVDWAAFDAPYRRRRVPWATYPFERARHWLEPRKAQVSPSLGDGLLGRRLHTAALGEGEAIFQAEWSAQAPAYLKDHLVDGRTVVPLTAYLHAALAAGAAVKASEAIAVAELCVERPLALEAAPHRVQAIVRTRAEGAVTFSFHDAPAGPEPVWTRGATARIEPAAAPAGAVDLTGLRGQFAGPEADLAAFDADCRAAGVEYGPSFRHLARLWVGESEALAELRPPPADLRVEAGAAPHPAWLDAVLQVMGALVGAGDRRARYRPIAIGRVRLGQIPDGPLWCHARLRPGGRPDMVRGDLRLHDGRGGLVGLFEDVEFRAGSQAHRPAGGDLYELAWRPLAPAWSAPQQGVSMDAFRAAGELGLEQALANRRAVAELEDLATEAMAAALASLSGDLAQDEILTLEPLMARLGVADRHRHLVERMLQVLEPSGRARRVGMGWRLSIEPVAGVLAHRFSEAERHAEIVHELRLLRRASDHLADVLGGRHDPLEILFPRGDLTDATNLYERSLPPTLLNGMVLDAVKRLIAAAPIDRPVRILELGAGTGATAARLLESLPAGRFHYVFTDVSTAFLGRARLRFQGRSEIDYRVLDIETSPAAQGLAPGAFDVVIAANMLHTARDLRQALGHARELLRPGGTLLAVEANAPRIWADVVFGGTDGWWRFRATEGERGHALLTTAAWRDHLAEAGFEGIETSEPGEAHGAGLGHVLLMACAKAAAAGPWVVLADDPQAARPLVAGLQARGAPVIEVVAGTGFQTDGPGRYRLDPKRVEQLDRLFAQETLAAAPAGVVRLWPAESSEQPLAGAQAHLEEGLALTQALVRRGYPASPELAFVTRGVHAEGAGEAAVEQAGLWGLAKTVALEHPELRCRCIDLDEDADRAAFDTLADELLAGRGEPAVALRRDGPRALRLVRAPARSSEGPRLRPDGAYLITGGTRGLGLLAAEWMAERGARDLTLVGRRPPPPESRLAIDRLRDRGVTVRVLAADVGQAAEVQAVLDRIARDGQPLRGVVHAAGALDDRVLLNQTPARFAAVMNAKAAGAWHLHRLTAGLPIEAFVVFSSIASLFGARAQANHAAANAFVDALCHVRRAAGLPAVSINWGPWRDIGAAAARNVESRGFNRGIASFDPARGLEILASVWGLSTAQVGAAAVDWPEFLTGGEPSPLYRELAPANAQPSAVPAKAAPAAPSQAVEGPMAERIARVVGRVLGVAPETLDHRQGLFDMGLDSLGAITLRHALQDEIGRPLAATVVFRFSTIEALVGHLAREEEAPPTEVAPVTPGPAAEDWETWSEEALAEALALELGDAGLPGRPVETSGFA